MYPEHLTIPMEKDLTDFGFEGLKTAEAVNELLSKKEGTVLVVVNSVCGCAAGNCRPGVKMAAQNAKLPDNMATVFAGVDKAAVDQARAFMLPYPPSSPSIALFKEGRLVHFLERHHIEGNTADAIAANLKMAFDKFC
ncbi:BrxA/BrxB family bacilliredoxin [Aureispira anguillae]|uniref:BrxA/BrxB family bacilliredoxin n=1 Tax=Aureispira anguillae TaxID=2864201 RepID=A0A915YL30_9BACT|nr:BrxA/BrxB family bacilliredoxin [Aureispira anguillae]BDS14748.1 BrxA/BrxB family bacilliredoxin [Aureispira anguillae]